MSKKYIDGRIVELTDEERDELERRGHADTIRERSRPLCIEEVYGMLVQQKINDLKVDSNTALRMVSFYPEWAADVFYAIGYKIHRNGKLWEVVQAHTSQIGWEPENAASLYTQVCETHDGTEDDPIPYEGNMALENGKYYEQYNVVYRCFRDTINPVYHALSDLVGLYVEVAY